MNGMMRKVGLHAIGIALLLAVGACYEHTVTVGGGAPRGPVVYEEWQNFWLKGLIGHTRLDIERLCPSGRATIVAEQTFLNGLVTGLTAGIYTPTKLTVRCADGRRADVDLTEEDIGRIVADPGFREWVARTMPERLDEVVAAQATLQER